MAQCTYIKDDGARCGQSIPNDKQFCLWHDPDRREEAQAIRALGGINRKMGSAAQVFPGRVKNIDDLMNMLNALLEDVWGWPENSEKRAKTLIQIGYLFKDLIPLSDQDQRIADLEGVIYGTHKTPTH
jgi:hypothetical protein